MENIEGEKKMDVGQEGEGERIAGEWIDRTEKEILEVRQQFYNELLSTQKNSLNAEDIDRMKVKMDNMIGRYRAPFLDYLTTLVLYKETGSPIIYEEHQEAMLAHTIQSLTQQLDAEMAFNTNMETAYQQRKAGIHQLQELTGTIDEAAMITKAFVSDLHEHLSFLVTHTNKATEAVEALYALRSNTSG